MKASLKILGFVWKKNMISNTFQIDILNIYKFSFKKLKWYVKKAYDLKYFSWYTCMSEQFLKRKKKLVFVKQCSSIVQNAVHSGCVDDGGIPVSILYQPVFQAEKFSGTFEEIQGGYAWKCIYSTWGTDVLAQHQNGAAV